MTRQQAAADIRRRLQDATPRGDGPIWTWPYKCPPGTVAVQVLRIEADIAYLSDGSSMHKSHIRRTVEGSVRA